MQGDKAKVFIKITPKKRLTQAEIDELKKKLEESGIKEYYILKDIDK